MNKPSSVIALMAVLLLSGCHDESAVGSRNAAGINCAIEIQIAVLNTPFKPGRSINDGDWRVAAACVLPVHSTGGPGRVVSNTNGTIIQIEWTTVQLVDSGNAVVFEGFVWEIANRIDRRDGVSHTFGKQRSDRKHFGSDFEWLLGPAELDTMSEERTGRRLVVRGRFMPKAPPAQPLNLAELVERSP